MLHSGHCAVSLAEVSIVCEHAGHEKLSCEVDDDDDADLRDTKDGFETLAVRGSASRRLRDRMTVEAANGGPPENDLI